IRFLLEHWPCVADCPADVAEIGGAPDFYPEFVGIRTGVGLTTTRIDPENIVYLQYVIGSGEFEYYDLGSDQPQINNLCFSDPSECDPTMSGELVVDWVQFLSDLTECDALDDPGYECQDLE